VTEASTAGAHFLEVRGRAEAAVIPGLADGHLSSEVIRVHPQRVIAFNVGPDQPGLEARDITG
jgi:pyridoxamine 5'-phosphate oxidase family protein